jgi:hypothetical protein
MEPPSVVKVVKKRPLGRRLKLYGYALLVIAAPVLCFALYTLFKLSWSYADGDRSGILQKFSRKGWVCKTYEGEISVASQIGAVPVLWEFSVRDEEVAKKINGLLGQKVVLHYKQHPGVPTSCFGDTEYFVDGADALR